jgi:hypothetical protein
MTMQTAQLIGTETSEEELVFRWRLEQLEEAGYPSRVAGELAARRDVDLHFAVGLLQRGCEPATALRILL